MQIERTQFAECNRVYLSGNYFFFSFVKNPDDSVWRFYLYLPNATVGNTLTVDFISPNGQLLLSSLQVLSGCAIIVRGQPRGGPPPERQINLSNIRAGAMARRAAQGQPEPKDTPDEVSGSVPLCSFVCLFVYVCVCVCLAKAEQGPAKKALQHKTVTFQFGWVNAVVRRTWLCCPHFHRASSCTTIYIWISIQSMPDYINDDVA